MEADLAVAGGALVEQIAGFLAGGGESAAESEKVAKLAQVGPTSVFSSCIPTGMRGQLASAGPT
jgi:hypothetical protein